MRELFWWVETNQPSARLRRSHPTCQTKSFKKLHDKRFFVVILVKSFLKCSVSSFVSLQKMWKNPFINLFLNTVVGAFLSYSFFLLFFFLGKKKPVCLCETINDINLLVLGKNWHYLHLIYLWHTVRIMQQKSPLTSLDFWFQLG